MEHNVPKRIAISIVTSLLLLHERNAAVSSLTTHPPPLPPNQAVSRRNWILGTATFTSTSASSSLLTPRPSYAASPPPPPPLTLSKSSSRPQPPRIEEIGGGFDLLSPPPPKSPDAIYPASLLGVWECQKAVVSSEGDRDQAKLAWRALGGGDTADGDEIFAGKKSERFYMKFVDPPAAARGDAANPYGYEYEGKTLTGVVADRAYETESRLDARTTATTATPTDPRHKNRAALVDGTLDYTTARGTNVSLTVVQRTIEPPSETGFGSDELYRTTTSAGGLVPGNVVRAARVKRRFRRAFDVDGNRVVEGLEIVKTYRVLDGVAGVEMPTSTTKSMIRFVRPVDGLTGE